MYPLEAMKATIAPPVGEEHYRNKGRIKKVHSLRLFVFRESFAAVVNYLSQTEAGQSTVLNRMKSHSHNRGRPSHCCWV